MKNYFDKSTLELLPDEILLEICKYLLCGDILQGFFGLNSRMTRMITQYCHHVSLHKISITQCSYLCTTVLPQTGIHIRSLVINRSFSLMLNDLFIKYFRTKMSIVFPRLEKITLVAFRYSHLIAFLDTLQDLNNLIEIRLHQLVEDHVDCQTPVLQKLLQANNNQLTTILLNSDSSYFTFNEICHYPNILQLRLNMLEMKELPILFAAIPNVCYLDIVLKHCNKGGVSFDEMHNCSLPHLMDFRLRSTLYWWTSKQLSIILDQIRNIHNLSLFLCTTDSHLVDGRILLPLLPTGIRQFNYSVYYFPQFGMTQDDEIVASWPSSHPVRCISGDTHWLVHSLPWNFERMAVLTSFSKIMCSQINREAGYDKHVERLEMFTNQNFTISKSFAIIAQCRQIRILEIIGDKSGDIVQEEKQPPPSLPRLSRLTQIQFYPSSTNDVDHLSPILIVAPNLFRLDLPSDCLIRLLENQQITHLLGQQIMSLNIYGATTSSQFKLHEEHIALIASHFTTVRDLYVDLKHVPASEETAPSSTESMLVYILSKFESNKLISLCVDVQPSEKMKTDVKQWLKDNTILCNQEFDAKFNADFKRLIIWM